MDILAPACPLIERCGGDAEASLADVHPNLFEKEAEKSILCSGFRCRELRGLEVEVVKMAFKRVSAAEDLIRCQPQRDVDGKSL